VNYSIDDVEKHLFAQLNRLRTNGAPQSAHNFKHGITSMMNISIKIKKALPVVAR
jgi:hypothetical protein